MFKTIKNIARKLLHTAFDVLAYVLPAPMMKMFPRFDIPNGLYDVNLDNIRMDRSDGVQFERIFEPCLLEDKVPLPANDLEHWRFRCVKRPIVSPAAYNYSPFNGKAYFSDPAVITENGKLIVNAVYLFHLQYHDHPVSKLRHMPKLRRLPEESPVIIVSPGSKGYYHWLLEIIPKILMAARHSEPIGPVYLVHDNLPFQKESMAAIQKDYPGMEFRRANLMPYVMARKPLIPGNPGLSTYPSPSVVSILRETLLPHAVELDGPHKKKLFLKRNEVITTNDCIFEKELTLMGFSIVECADFSFLEQIHLFNKAEFIVAPHGAALSNLVFCNEGTKVLELFSGDYVCEHFSSISDRNNLTYKYLVDSMTPRERYTHTRASVMNFEVAEILGAVRSMHDW